MKPKRTCTSHRVLQNRLQYFQVKEVDLSADKKWDRSVQMCQLLPGAPQKLSSEHMNIPT